MTCPYLNILIYSILRLFLLLFLFLLLLLFHQSVIPRLKHAHDHAHQSTRTTQATKTRSVPNYRILCHLSAIDVTWFPAQNNQNHWKMNDNGIGDVQCVCVCMYVCWIIIIKIRRISDERHEFKKGNIFKMLRLFDCFDCASVKNVLCIAIHDEWASKIYHVDYIRMRMNSSLLNM